MQATGHTDALATRAASKADLAELEAYMLKVAIASVIASTTLTFVIVRGVAGG